MDLSKFAEEVTGSIGPDGSTRAFASSSSSSSSRESKRSTSTTTGRHTNTRIRPIGFTVLRATGAHHGHGLSQLFDNNPRTFWSTGSGCSHELILKLDQPSLVGYLKIHNRHTSAVQVYVSRRGTGRTDWVLTDARAALPHGRTHVIKGKFLPGTYVKLRLVRGSPVSLFSLELFGVETERVARDFGGAIHELCVEQAETSLRLSKKHGVREDRFAPAAYPLDQHHDPLPHNWDPKLRHPNFPTEKLVVDVPETNDDKNTVLSSPVIDDYFNGANASSSADAVAEVQQTASAVTGRKQWSTLTPADIPLNALLTQGFSRDSSQNIVVRSSSAMFGTVGFPNATYDLALHVSSGANTKPMPAVAAVATGLHTGAFYGDTGAASKEWSSEQQPNKFNPLGDVPFAFGTVQPSSAKHVSKTTPASLGKVQESSQDSKKSSNNSNKSGKARGIRTVSGRRTSMLSKSKSARGDNRPILGGTDRVQRQERPLLNRNAPRPRVKYTRHKNMSALFGPVISDWGPKKKASSSARKVTQRQTRFVTLSRV